MRRASEALDAFASAHRVPKAVSQPLQVALDEVLSNTVRYGYGAAGRSGEIDLRFALIEGGVEVVVVDDAPAFDPRSAGEPDTQASLEGRKVGGLGLYLVRRLLDAVEYERAEGRNRLRLVKRVAG